MKPNNNLDQWLDRALDQYANVEPRAELEKRILATIDVERKRSFVRRRRWLILGTAFASCAIAAAVWLGYAGNRRAREPQRPIQTTTVSPVALPPRQSSRRSSAPRFAGASSRPVLRARHNPSRAASIGLPKADQFPSPRPLSEEEKLLVAYANALPPSEIRKAAAEQANIDRDLHISDLEIKDLETPPLDRD